MTLDCVHPSGALTTNTGMNDPGPATRSPGAAAIFCLRSPNTPLEWLVEDYGNSPSADHKQFIGLEHKAGSIAVCTSSFPQGPFAFSRTFTPTFGSSCRLARITRGDGVRAKGVAHLKCLWPDPVEARPDRCMATMASPYCAASDGAYRIRLVSRCPRRVRWRSPPGRASAMRRSPVPPGAPGPPPRAGASPAASRRTRT